MEGFSGLRSDFSTLSLASYMIELTELLFPPGVIDQKMFELLKDSFFAMDKGVRNDILKIIFEARAMTLAGFGIELSKCYRCQRPYKGKGNAVFKPEKGGIACLRCEEESVSSPGLMPDAVKALQWMQMHHFVGDIQKAPLTDEMALVIRHVLRLHIQYRVGNRLKTAEFLE
jgi:DNA repair protein RecO (recombination protein O)